MLLQCHVTQPIEQTDQLLLHSINYNNYINKYIYIHIYIHTSTARVIIGSLVFSPSFTNFKRAVEDILIKHLYVYICVCVSSIHLILENSSSFTNHRWNFLNLPSYSN